MGEGSEWIEDSRGNHNYIGSCETHKKTLSGRQKENRDCRTCTLGKVQGGKEEGGIEVAGARLWEPEAGVGMGLYATQDAHRGRSESE